MAQSETPVSPPAPSVGGSAWFWRLLAALMMLSVAWVLWLMWQITPRSLVTDMAFQRAAAVRAAPVAATPRPEIAPPAANPGAPAELQQGDPVGLKLSTELQPPAKAEAPAAPSGSAK